MPLEKKSCDYEYGPKNIKVYYSSEDFHVNSIYVPMFYPLSKYYQFLNNFSLIKKVSTHFLTF